MPSTLLQHVTQHFNVIPHFSETHLNVSSIKMIFSMFMCTKNKSICAEVLKVQ